MIRCRSFLSLGFFVAASAGAAIGDRYGYTSEDAALGGARAGAAEISSSSAYTNPAQMSLASEGRRPNTTALRFHWSALYAESNFTGIHGVVTQNPVTSDLNNGDPAHYGNVDTKYPATFGQSLGFAVRSRKSPYHWGFGAVAYLPLDRLALLDSGESIVPEYSLHRGRTQKPEFQFAFSGAFARNMSVGVGAYLGARLASDTTIFLNQGVGTASTMRISASLKTQATPYFGWSFVPSADLSLGLALRLAAGAPESFNVRANARAVGTVTAPDFSFPALATMHYEPFTVSPALRWRYVDDRTLYLQLDYQAWSKFESPTILIQNQSCDPNCGVDFAAGRNFSGATRDIFVPRVGHAWRFGTREFRAGYAYRPGIYRELPTGAGNAIDPDEHRLSAGFGWEVATFPLFDAPGRLGFHGSYAIYPRRTVTKLAGDENGNTANLKIGAPGYEIGGSAWAAGFTAELSL